MITANELACNSGLSRKTCSVTRDSKRDQLIIVEEISETGKEFPRSDVYYFIYEDVSTSEVNSVLREAKDRATLAFLGLDQTRNVEGVEDEPIQAEPIKEVEAKTPSKSESKPVAKKKATRKKKVVVKDTVAEVEPEVAEEPEVEDDLLLDETETPPIVVLFDKANREHAGFLRPVVVEAFGTDWKKDKDSMGKVRSLIAKLNGKVEVSDVEGNVLSTFSTTAKAMIA